MTKYKNKKSFIGLICIVLIVILSVGSLGFLSSGFRDWAVKDWFKKDEPEAVNYFDPTTVRFSSDLTNTVAFDDVANTITFSATPNKAGKSNPVPLDISGGKKIIFSGKLLSFNGTSGMYCYFTYRLGGLSRVSTAVAFKNVGTFMTDFTPLAAATDIGLVIGFEGNSASSNSFTLGDVTVIQNGSDKNLFDKYRLNCFSSENYTPIVSFTEKIISLKSASTSNLSMYPVYLGDVIAANDGLLVKKGSSVFDCTSFFINLTYYDTAAKQVKTMQTNIMTDTAKEIKIVPALEEFRILSYYISISPIADKTIKLDGFGIYSFVSETATA